ncbi:hypothetical protein [Streptomyces griseorubiginosus]|uniref:hypothetical protein n=1 Tax=Streptomyces griseorubiginosus TaxID=67304 RepID=UPI00131C40BF|nr:hypothetical protein [Streptomyces griseorubiginosus]
MSKGPFADGHGDTGDAGAPVARGEPGTAGESRGEPGRRRGLDEEQDEERGEEQDEEQDVERGEGSR